MKKIFFVLGISSLCFLMMVFFVVVNKTFANTLIGQTVEDVNQTLAPATNNNLQKPTLAISVNGDKVSMNVVAPGALAVTIYSRGDNGEIRVNIPIRMIDGTWSLLLPAANFLPGSYNSYAIVDSGLSIFGQSNTVSYIIKAPTSQDATLLSDGQSTTSQVGSAVGSVTIDSTQLKTQQSGGTAISADNQANDPGVQTGQITSNQSAVDLTVLPEKFAKNLEQIKSTKIIESGNQFAVTIESIKNVELSSADDSNNTNKKNAISFSGKAKPNYIIYLYIFSDPIVVSVKADENGNWQYILDRPLDTGKHESYVLIEDPQTKEILRTEAKSFFISKARASSSMLDIPGNKGIMLEDPFYGMIKDYIIYVAIVVGMAILAVLFFGLRKFRNVEIDETNSESKSK